jgi:hypothetical protein
VSVCAVIANGSKWSEEAVLMFAKVERRCLEHLFYHEASRRMTRVEDLKLNEQEEEDEDDSCSTRSGLFASSIENQLGQAKANGPPAAVAIFHRDK